MARKIFPMPPLPPGRLRNVVVAVQSRLPELNFITLHYTYFVFTCLFSGLVFWGSSTPFGSVSFIDSLFLTTSAMTEAGLNTVNLSELNTWQQVILFLLIILGSTIFVSIFILLVRVKAFEKAFENLKQEHDARKLKRRTSGFSRTKSFFSRGHTVSPNDLYTSSTTRNTNLNIQQDRGVMNDETGHDQSSSTTATGTPRPTSDREMWATTSQNSEDQPEIQQEGSIEPQPHSHTVQTLVGQDARDPDTSLSPSTPHIGFSEGTKFGRRTDDAYHKINKPVFSFTGVGASASSTLRSRSLNSSRRSSIARAVPLPELYGSSTNAYFTSGGWISRNSQFHGLTNDERMLLGGCEYKAVLFLSFLVPFYFVIWQLLGAVALGAYVYTKRPSTAAKNGIGPFWVGSFNAISSFNNSGMSLLDANMIAFQNSLFMLLSMGLFILAGNTAFPIFLRAAVWTIWKLIPTDDPHWYEDKRTLRFLLDHPRRCYTNMFPSRHTWWLATTLIVLNGIDWTFFPILNIGNPKITDYLSSGREAIDSLFQALAVRSGGFYVVPIPDLRISLQFLYVVMMYISVYPVVISMRNSNVYEERSLGVYVEDIQEPEDEGDDTNKMSRSGTGATGKSSGQLGTDLKRRLTNLTEKAVPAPQRETRSYFVRHQLRAQLSHDAWFLGFAIFLILIIEASQFEAHPTWFSAFNVIFEVVSGYATVGISVGVPYNAFSFCGSWHTLSKLILVVVMLRGRHRGLPVAIDHAVQLPGFHLYDAENEDGERRLDKLERSHTMRSKTTTRSNGDLNMDIKSPTLVDEAGDNDDIPTATGREEEKAGTFRKPTSPQLSAGS